MTGTERMGDAECGKNAECRMMVEQGSGYSKAKTYALLGLQKFTKTALEPVETAAWM